MASETFGTVMKVMKRNGSYEDVAFEKVQERIRKAGEGLSVNATLIAQQVLTRIVDGIKTTELDDIAAKLAESMCTTHIDYGTLAARIAISNHQKQTPKTFVEAMNTVASIKDRRGDPANLLSDEFLKVVNDNADLIESKIDYNRDYLFDYFGFKTLERAYLLQDKIKGYVIERPQHLWMRVAIGLWYDNHGSPDLEKAFQTYELLSMKKYTHATPTLFNAGTKRPQLSSCFLMGVDDSIKGIYKTLTDCALISQYGGGIGIHVSNVRGAGSLIRGTGGTSNGIMPMLRVFNNTARYVDQCFVGETIINGWFGSGTSGIGYKKIADIEPGDNVYTSGTEEVVDEHGKHYNGTKDGKHKLCKVIKKVEHEYEGDILEIHTADNVIKVTPKHPILAIRHVSGLRLDEMIKAGYVIGKEEYIEANDLRVGDYGVLYDSDTYNYAKIEDITIHSYKGKLYDLEVEGTHDYAVSGFAFAHNGGGKRNGSFAIYLEPWHSDVETFLEMKKNTGAEEERARDLFYALWIPDLFMERVDKNGSWSLFCPDEAPGLADVVGDEFKALYEKYEAEGRAKKTVSAQKLWFKILDSQIETGTPYLLYKDAANLKSNQQNLGVIKSSNLCTEIIEYTAADEIAVCNLASMNLPSFVKDGEFDFKQFRSVVKTVIRNLNRVIDINYYPVAEAEKSNKRHRPIGLGVQGLADVFAMLKLPWESSSASELNKKIFAHMYYASVEASVDLAASEGTYETFFGSPAHAGKLQYDLWNIEPYADADLDWDALVNAVQRIGMRNSLLIAPMPTASTAQILGNTESIEPIQQNIFTRRTLAGEFFMMNKHLMKALLERGLWTTELKDKIIGNNGSVQGLDEVPADIQILFKTVWELKMKTLIDMAADRAPYICQSQSLNLFIGDATYAKLTSMHFYAWRKGLKTGIYYLRTRAVASAQKFTIDPKLMAKQENVISHSGGSSGSKQVEKGGSGGGAGAGAGAAASEEKECIMCSS
jgi:ribonucleoside-diphosphate reductase alpha subunit